jgi:hypothetical protein
MSALMSIRTRLKQLFGCPWDVAYAECVGKEIDAVLLKMDDRFDVDFPVVRYDQYDCPVCSLP